MVHLPIFPIAPGRGSGSLRAAHSRTSTRYCQLAMTSGFMRMVWPMVSRNMNKDASVHTLRAFFPERISRANTGSAIIISQARRTFSTCGDQVLSNSAATYPTNTAGPMMIHFERPAYSNHNPKKKRTPNRKNLRVSYFKDSMHPPPARFESYFLRFGELRIGFPVRGDAAVGRSHPPRFHSFLAGLLDRQSRFAEADAVITELDRKFPQ